MVFKMTQMIREIGVNKAGQGGFLSREAIEHRFVGRKEIYSFVSSD